NDRTERAQSTLNDTWSLLDHISAPAGWFLSRRESRDSVGGCSAASRRAASAAGDGRRESCAFSEADPQPRTAYPARGPQRQLHHFPCAGIDQGEFLVRCAGHNHQTRRRVLRTAAAPAVNEPRVLLVIGTEHEKCSTASRYGHRPDRSRAASRTAPQPEGSGRFCNP